jgi:hypothetical protein
MSTLWTANFLPCAAETPTNRIPPALPSTLSMRLFRSNVLLEERCALSWHSKPSHLIGLDMTSLTDTMGLSTTSSVFQISGRHVLENHQSVGKELQTYPLTVPQVRSTRFVFCLANHESAEAQTQEASVPYFHLSNKSRRP